MGKFPKNESENNRKEEGLEHKPSWAKNCLFVLGKKVPTYKKVEKVAILPDTGKVKSRPSSGWFEYGNIFLCFDEA